MVDSALKRLNDLKKPGKWLIASLEAVQEYHGEGRKDPGWFHPSGLGEVCDAKLAFDFLGAPAVQNITARLQRIFDNGSGRDEYLKRDMARSGVSLIRDEAERKIELPQYRIRGELDDLVQNPLDKKIFVVDYKTMRSDLFKALEAAKPEHKIQVLPYEYAKRTSYGLVMYENKDTQELKVMEADFDPAKWTEITLRLERILTGLQEGYVTRNPVSCGYCPYFNNGVCGTNQIAKLKEESGLYV